MSGLHFHPLRVAAVTAEGDDAMLLDFELPPALREPFRFEPGQYLTLRQVVDGSELRRSYSICAAPGEALRVGIRLLPGGAFSGWARRALKAGDRLDVMPPQGRFGAALARRPRHVLALAGGSGITPLLSILKAALAMPGTRCTLVYANRLPATTMFREALEDLKDRHLSRLALHLAFSREAGDPPLRGGRLDAARLAPLLRLAGPVDEAFVCGPQAFNDEMQAALQAAGLAPERVHVERFGVPAAALARVEPHPEDAAQAQVTVLRDGRRHVVAVGPGDANLLAAAVRAGLDLPFSCRSGVCATCRARVLEGQVRMDRNFALEADDLAAGFVLTCQAHPVSDRVLLSFDER